MPGASGGTLLECSIPFPITLRPPFQLGCFVKIDWATEHAGSRSRISCPLPAHSVWPVSKTWSVLEQKWSELLQLLLVSKQGQSWGAW